MSRKKNGGQEDQESREGGKEGRRPFTSLWRPICGQNPSPRALILVAVVLHHVFFHKILPFSSKEEKMVLILDDLDPILEEEELLPNPNFLLPFPNDTAATRCSPRLLDVSMWLILLLDVLLALLAILFNALLVPSAFLARPIPFRIRRTLSSIALSYALLAGILLAKKCFWLFTALEGGVSNPGAGRCMPVLSSVACKLQEFPVVFIFLHTLALPLTFALRLALGRWYGGGARGRETAAAGQVLVEKTADLRTNKDGGSLNHSNKNRLIFTRLWPKEGEIAAGEPGKKGRPSLAVAIRPPAGSSPPLPYWLCSTQQILLVVACLGMALLFTAFDPEPPKRKLMANCSIALAIRQKGLAFGLLSLILLAQMLQSTLWYFIPARAPQGKQLPAKRSGPSSLMAYLVLSCRDLFLLEAIGWSLVALLTGTALLLQFVMLRPCTKCTRLAIELSFTSLPLLIALCHPILSLLFIAPVRYSAQRFCPILAKLFPTQEPVTPPLPRLVPAVRILITEH